MIASVRGAGTGWAEWASAHPGKNYGAHCPPLGQKPSAHFEHLQDGDALSVVHDIGTFLNASALRRAHFSEVQREMIENRRIGEEESIMTSRLLLKTMMKRLMKQLKAKRFLLAGQALELGSCVRLGG